MWTSQGLMNPNALTKMIVCNILRTTSFSWDMCTSCTKLDTNNLYYPSPSQYTYGHNYNTYNIHIRHAHVTSIQIHNRHQQNTLNKHSRNWLIIARVPSIHIAQNTSPHNQQQHTKSISQEGTYQLLNIHLLCIHIQQYALCRSARSRGRRPNYVIRTSSHGTYGPNKKKTIIPIRYATTHHVFGRATRSDGLWGDEGDD